MALYDALYKRFDGKVNLSLSVGGVVNAGDPSEEELEREWQIREQFDDLPRMEDIDWDKIGGTLDRVWSSVVNSTQTDGFKHAFGNHLEKIYGRIKVVED